MAKMTNGNLYGNFGQQKKLKNESEPRTKTVPGPLLFPF